MGADQTPLDLEAIRARLDAASPGMSYEVHVGASRLRATANTEDRPGFVEGMAGLVEAVTGATGPLTITLADDEDGQDATLALHAYSDLRRLLDENARLNAEFAEFREMAVLNTKAHTEALDRARAENERLADECGVQCREAAARTVRAEKERDEIAAKIGDGSEEWAIRVITEPGGTYWYHNESDGENPEQDLAITLQVLADGRDLAGNPVPHGPVSIVKRTVWSTEWETVEPSEMPRPPAEEAQERPEVPGTGSGRGTDERETHGRSQEAIAAIHDAHSSCDCGECLAEIDDALRPVHYREAAASLRAIAAANRDVQSEAYINGIESAAGRLDSVALDLDDEAPSLPVPSTEEARDER